MYSAAEEEGGESILRVGFYQCVRQTLKSVFTDDDQMSFSDINPQLMPYVAKLKHVRYHVDGVPDYLTAPELINDLALLEGAILHLRNHATDCLEEAQRLANLRDALVALREGHVLPANSEEVE